MKFIDFFAGVGGMRRGLEKSGHKCVGWCEWDKYARQSYEAIHNTEGEWTAHDIRTVRATDLPGADLWCFGFPCTDISVAGKMQGFFKDKEQQTIEIEKGEQTRSGLFYEIIRLLQGLSKEDRPKWLLAENVKNLLSIDRGWGFARCLVALGEAGYICEWQVFNTKYSYNVAGVCVPGIPQNRERVYLVGRLAGETGGRKVFPIDRADKENPVELSQIGRLKTQANCDEESVSTTNRDNPQRMRVYDRDGLAPALNTMQGGGQEPLITEELKVKQIGHIEGYQLENPQAYRVYDESGAAPTLTSAADGKVPWIVDDLYKCRDGRVYTDSAPTLRTNCGGLNVVEESKIKVLGSYSPSGYNATRVVDPSGVAPTVMENHGQVTAVTVIGGLQEHQTPRTDGVCPTLTSAMGMGGGNTPCVSYQPISTPDRTVKHQNGRRIKDDGEPMFTLTTQDTHGVLITENE